MDDSPQKGEEAKVISADIAAPLCTHGAVEASLPLIVAIDVGQKNLSLCALRLLTPPSGSDSFKLLLNDARERLRKSVLVVWEVVNLNPTPSALSFVERSAAIADFVHRRAYLFANASVVIIEHQMHSLMRGMAAALFACISLYAKNDARLLSQHSSSKLRWEDMIECTGCGDQLQKYSQRKKVAVKCADFLLDVPNCLVSNQQPALQATYANESQTICDMRKTSQSTVKRDDLADALLHLLVHDCKTKPAAKKRRLG